MKKVSLIVALIALCGLAASTFADVQNIRLSGDIRVDGYFTDGTGVNGVKQSTSDAQFVTQRTRVTVEADLEDHVLVVVTLQATGIWGKSDTVLRPANGASRTWSVGVSEAYVQLRELFYSPATLKVGRQELNYGTGLIISSFDQIYTFDAGRLVLDYHPLTIDIVGAQLANSQTFNKTQNGGSEDLLFVNAKYEVNGAVKDIEAYLGWVSQNPNYLHTFGTVGGGTTASPMLAGLRTDLTPCENLTASLEGAYEFGQAGIAGDPGQQISAFIANAAAKYTFKGVAWTPAINAAYTFAQGGGNTANTDTHYFQPWFGMAEGYNGYVLAPLLSNMQIINLGASVKPAANTTLALQGYYYLKADKNGYVSSDPNANLGGLGFGTTASNNSRDIGGELDAIVGYDYSKDVRFQLVYGAFLPENAYKANGATPGTANRIASEVRGELCVKF